MRIVALNVRNGGGDRIAGIAAAVLAHGPDIAVLSEFNPATRGPALLALLAAGGLVHHRAGVAPNRRFGDTVAIASRLPLGPVRVPLAGSPNAHRVLEADADGMTVGAVYFPLDKPKIAFWREEFLPYARTRLDRPCVLVGDWNSGLHRVDEEGATLGAAPEFAAMSTMGWTDAWRDRHADTREFTWFSRIGNGFRLDHAFLSPLVASRLVRAEYDHGTRRREVSDHSALVVDIA